MTQALTYAGFWTVEWGKDTRGVKFMHKDKVSEKVSRKSYVNSPFLTIPSVESPFPITRKVCFPHSLISYP